MKTQFRDRIEAGRLLAAKLGRYAYQPAVLVLALPRGGVPVALEVARALHAPLGVFVVRKLGVPGQEELAMGAVASGGVLVLNEGVVKSFGISDRDIAAVAERELDELRRREQAYRGVVAAADVRRRTVILVDDGIATGATMRAAVEALRQLKASRIVAAVPVAAASTVAKIRLEVDAFVSVLTPEGFSAVGEWYERFPQVTDEEVCAACEAAGRLPAPQP